MGEHATALNHYQNLLTLAEAIGNQYEKARAHHGIADALHGLDRIRESR